MRVRLLRTLVIALGLTVQGFVLADNLGCEVALCMANPKGPKDLVECHKPMDELNRLLARGKSFPKCDMGGKGETEKKGDEIVFRLDGEPTRYFNIKTGQYREESAKPVQGKPGTGSKNPTVQTQLR